MNTYEFKKRMKAGCNRLLAGVAPMTHFIPAGFRHRVADFIIHTGRLDKSVTDTWRPKPYQPGRYPQGVNLFGFFKAQNGLAQGVKLYARALMQSGYGYRLINTDFLDWLPQDDTTFDSMLSKQPRYAVNVVHINPDQWLDACKKFPNRAFDRHYTIGVWLWELENIPDAWTKTLPYVNELWAPSAFIASALEKVAAVPIRVIPYGIEAPYDADLTRKDFGLPDGRFLVLTMYDSNSYSSRKNPMGAMEAFIEAFGADADRAVLIIKVNNPKPEDIAAIREKMGKHPYILMDQTLTKERLNTLIRLCDVFISLHRSEGFGLVMAESMLLGRPVVATNWSANAEFMPPETACMVDCKLIPVGDHYQYPDKRNRWADADVHQAAAYLRRLATDRDFYELKARKGQEYISEHFSTEACAAKMAARLDEIFKAKDR